MVIVRLDVACSVMVMLMAMLLTEAWHIVKHGAPTLMLMLGDDVDDDVWCTDAHAS